MAQKPHPTRICLTIHQIQLWFRKDQALLSCILSSINETLVSSVYGLDSSYKVWKALLAHFSSQSRTRIAHIKRQLQTISQGNVAADSIKVELEDKGSAEVEEVKVKVLKNSAEKRGSEDEEG